MKKPTQILSEEHVNILKVIDVLLEECNTIESGKDVDKDFFERVIDFIRNYADKFHHAKEEDILFEKLCDDKVQLQCNPVQQMLYEHDLGRNFVKGIEIGLKQGDKGMVVDNARNYAHLLREHIEKEDSILYPMADSVLDEKTQKTMLSKFKQAEDKRFAKGVKEKYIALVKELENRM
ncbi:MAG: hemerythrin domain-containing protein [Candidatus Aenigmatarchaeota archaeon]